MMTVHQYHPRWLQDLLERAVAEGWCTRTNCSTCASEDLRRDLGLLDTSADRPVFRGMTPETAAAIVEGLKALTSNGVSGYQFEEPTRWLIYEVWRTYGDEYFSALDGTWAGDVLARMRAHHERRLEARRIHEARQGVKKRDWKE